MKNNGNQEDEQFVLRKKHTAEDSYFAERDKELIEKHKHELEQKKLEEQKKLHHMKCPKCGSDLMEIEFMDIMLDKCKKCGGVWFDKGEVQTLMKKEASFLGSIYKNLFGQPDVKEDLDKL
ncbi:MAG: zf-TFIIB domain-containing protein [Candidatus Eremiobacteraeota bacterium]|nr:zf-TFIIB domain-containing protein [Candidatus Eremiobacteraeota bacterium]